MKELLAKLEAATEADQERLIWDAVQYAYNRSWIFTPTCAKAHSWVRSGAYMSAAMVLMPEGWAIRNLWQAVKPKDWPWWGIQLWRPEPYKVLPSVLGAATPALAVAIAALRAWDQVKGAGN